MKKLLLFGALAFGLNTFGQVPSYVPNNGLVGWWPFNGNSNDESGNGNNGTVSGATLTDDRNSNLNSAYSFDGVNDFILIQNSILPTNVSSYSISLWLNPISFPYDYSEVICDRDANTYAHKYRISVANNGAPLQPGTFYCLMGDGLGETHCYDTTLISNNSWIHYVVTFNFNLTEMKIFKNGELVASNYSTGNGVGYPSQSTSTYIGQSISPAGFDNAFHGKIDDIGIWNRALTQCEIQDLYNTQLNSTSFSVTQNGAQLTADQTGASYQWLDCDNNYAIINGETNQSYTPAVTGNYAVEVNMNGCIDTSACLLVDYTGIEELIQTEKQLIKILDFMGRETEFKPNTPLIYIYSDGTRERVMKLEE